MRRWLVVVSLSGALLGCSKDKPEQAAPAMSEPAPQAGMSAQAGAESGRAAAQAGSTPQPSAAGAGVAGRGGAGAGGSTPAAAGSEAGSSGQPATAGQTAATMPAATLSITVMPDREHLYDDASKWLCLPGMKDELCTTGLDATIVRKDGSKEMEPHVVAKEPGFDCFYVYPTVSNDPGSNADWNAGSEETNCVRGQAGRYSRVCRVFAPLYRQVTLTALNSNSIDDAARTMGYQDVVAAFNRYLTEYNKGRGFVLIGHSQGSGVLRKLIVSEIDGRQELRDRLIAAHLLGTSLPVPEGQDVGGDLKNVPLCRRDDQFGCVIAYATFRDRSPPPSNSRFGKVAMGRAACTNPGALGGGKGILLPYFNPSQIKGAARFDTPYLSLPDFLEAECVDRGEFTYLQLKVLADSRASDVGGDITADWGLHMVDMPIAEGSLVNLAASQAKAFAARK